MEDMIKEKLMQARDEIRRRQQEINKRKSTLTTGENNAFMGFFQNKMDEIRNDKLGKIQEMLLQKLISFDCLDTQNADGIKRKLYNFFFNWQKDLNDDMLTSHGNTDHLENESRMEKLNDDYEEKKKRMQLKRDLELIEFEERGGFAQILRDIFNP